MWEFYMHANCLRVMVRKAGNRYVSVAMEEKLLNICYTASTVGSRNFYPYYTNHSRRCKIYIYTENKGKIIKGDSIHDWMKVNYLLDFW
jgi:L-rhamnose isomerase